jgi:hypothetical protein
LKELGIEVIIEKNYKFGKNQKDSKYGIEN